MNASDPDEGLVLQCFKMASALKDTTRGTTHYLQYI